MPPLCLSNNPVKPTSLSGEARQCTGHAEVYVHALASRSTEDLPHIGRGVQILLRALGFTDEEAAEGRRVTCRKRVASTGL